MDLGLRGGSDFWRCAKDQKPLELRFGMSFVYEVCGEEECCCLEFSRKKGVD